MSKKQIIFNIISIILLISIIGFYGYRAINFMSKEKSKKTLSTILSERIIEEEESFYLVTEIEKVDNTYYFMKTTTNNYVYYKDMLWRIIKVNDDKTTTIILNDYVTTLPYESTNKWLNKTNEENSGIYSTLLDGNNIELLTIDDYNNTGGNKSFINNDTDFWIQNNKYIDNDGNIKESDNNEHKVRPVITLPSDTTIYAGTGGVDKPFVIEKHVNKYFVKDLNTNKYVLYNNMLWRVIEKYDDKVKLICEENIKDDDNLVLLSNFSDYDNDINRRKNLIYYLNNTYIKTLENQNYLTEGPFYIGKYENNDYTTIYSEVKNMKIGLPTIDNPYIYTKLDTFLLTSNYKNNKSIYSINNSNLYETLVSEKSGIRPVIYMKGNVSIKTGVGSEEKPYILGGLKDEKTK